MDQDQVFHIYCLASVGVVAVLLAAGVAVSCMRSGTSMTETIQESMAISVPVAILWPVVLCAAIGVACAVAVFKCLAILIRQSSSGSVE